MSRTWAVVKREFTESTRSKIFLVGTLFGPILIAALFAFQILMFRNTGGEKRIVIIDATPERIGAQVAAVLNATQLRSTEVRTRFASDVMNVAGPDADAARRTAERRVQDEEIDGVLYLPAGTLSGDSVRYEGRNATVMQEMAQMQLGVQAAVQGARLGAAGVDPARVAVAMQQVPFDARKAGRGAVKGSATAIFAVAYFMGYLTLLIIILYGAAVQRGVLEEKKDRIVEVVTSSIRAEQLMMGKVLGIGGASLVQVIIWVAAAAAALHWANPVIARFGGQPIHVPDIPGSVGLLAVLFFAGGYFLYSSFYATLGALATSDQEGQQLMIPVVMVLMASYFVSFRAMNAPDGAVAIVASLIPFSAPLVVPVRAMMTDIPCYELAASFALLVAGGLAIVWIGGKIYRIGILSTGRKPTFAEVVRWLRTTSY